MTKREEALKIWLPIIKMGVESMPECSEALDMAIKALEQEPCTVTEFADRCRECGAKYGKLLKQEPCEDVISRECR